MAVNEVGRELRTRRSLFDMTRDEQDRFRVLVGEAQADGRYAAVAGVYGLPYSHAPHHRPTVLPWGRAYLMRFEQEVLRSEQTGISLPLWNWVAEPDVPAFFRPDAYAGGNPLAGFDLARAQDLAPEHRDPPDRERAPGAYKNELPSAADVERVLALERLDDFREGIEQLSNRVHAWVGGLMGKVAYAAYDPLFWIHRAMVDALWWQWQQAHPLARGTEDEPLEPFGLTVAEVEDAAALGYGYEELELRAILPAAPVEQPPLARLAGAGNDRPATEDALGFGHYATAFAEIIASPHTAPPLTIGIFGSWGIGKSTLLDHVVREIERHQTDEVPKGAAADPAERPPYVHVVRFNAWDYDAQEAIWPALVRTVMDQIERDIPWGRWRRFRSLFARNARREWRHNRERIVVTALLLLATAAVAVVSLGFSPAAAASGLLVVGVGGMLKVASDTATSPTSAWLASLFSGRGYGARLAQIEDIRDDLQFLERRLRTEDSRNRRVLIVIDDLDRCEPDQAMQVLQAVNRLLDRDSFVVCMGIDARIVTAAIQQHYAGLLEQAGTSGYEYLDKIVQIPFRIPDPDPAALDAFLAMHLPSEPAAAPAPPRGTRGRRATVGPLPLEVGGDGAAPVAGMPMDERFAAPESQLDVAGAALGERVVFSPAEVAVFGQLGDFLRPNPRHVKRLINVYRLVRTLAESKVRVPELRRDARLLLDDPQATVRWLVLSAQWPYTARALIAEGRRHDRERAAAGTAPEDAMLGDLHERAKRTAHLRDGQERYDDDVERLEAFLSGWDLRWSTLRVICAYTVNFNPAVDDELQRPHRAHAEPAPPALGP